MLGTILLILVVLILIAALPTWPYSRSWGYYPSGGLTLVLVVILVLLLMGRRADTVLPATRDWMQTNAWVVSEAVIALFVVMQVNSIVTA